MLHRAHALAVRPSPAHAATRLAEVNDASAGVVAFTETAAALKAWQTTYRRVQQKSDQVLDGVYHDCNWDAQNACWLEAFNKATPSPRAGGHRLPALPSCL